MMDSKTRRGFTLIELLVVISIIAVLIAILMPALSSARKRAQDTVCGTRLKQLASGIEFYHQDFDDYFPNHTWEKIGDPPPQPGEPPVMTWHQTIVSRYFSGKFDEANELFFCPRDTRTPSNTLWWKWDLSYGSSDITFLRWGQPEVDWPLVKLSGLGDTARTIMVGDSGSPELRREMFMEAGGSWISALITKNWEGYVIEDYFFNFENIPSWDSTSVYRFPRVTAKRHRGGSNIAFADGHVEWVDYDTLHPPDGQPRCAWWDRK